MGYFMEIPKAVRQVKRSAARVIFKSITYLCSDKSTLDIWIAYV